MAVIYLLHSGEGARGEATVVAQNVREVCGALGARPCGALEEFLAALTRDAGAYVLCTEDPAAVRRAVAAVGSNAGASLVLLSELEARLPGEPRLAWLRPSEATENVLRAVLGPLAHADAQRAQGASESARARRALALADQMPELLGYWDASLRNRFANGSYAACFGRSPEEMPGLSLQELLGPELWALNEPFVRRALEGEVVEFEHRIPTATGVRHSKVRYLPVRLGGEVDGFVATGFDVSDLHAREARLALSEERFRTLTQRLPVGVMLLDAAGRPSYLNLQAQELFGRELTDVSAAIPAEDRPRVTAEWQRASEERRRFAASYRVRASSGELRWIEAVAEPTYAEGSLEGWIALFSDVTAAVEASRQNTRLRLVLDQISNGVTLLGLDGRYLFLNRSARRLAGLSAEVPVEALAPGSLGRELLASELDHELVRRAFREALETGQARCEITHQRDGARQERLLELTTHQEVEGAPKILSIIDSDITELRERERREVDLRESAESASRAKSQFLANMTHEIRTPMNAILGMGELLSGSELSPRQQAYVSTFRTSAEHLLRVLNDILDLAKVEAGMLTVLEEPIVVSELVETTVELMAGQAHNRQLELLVRVRDDAPRRALGDADRARQVLMNLLANALKFTERGEVRVEVSRGEEPDTVYLDVSDTGIGVAPERVDSIFEAFTQADASTTRRFGGTGLGLTISKQLAERMGGSLRVVSTSAKGSTFRLTLRAAQEGKRSSPPPELERLAGLRALVVDDNATNRLIVRELLEQVGVVVEEADGGVAAMASLAAAKARGEAYALLLLDYHMPDMDGVTLARSLRQSSLVSPTSTAVLMLSSASDILPEDARQRGGIDACLLKPIRRATLLERAYALLFGDGRASDSLAPRQRRLAPRTDDTPTTILCVDDVASNRELVEAYLAGFPWTVSFCASGVEALERLARHRFDVVLMDVQMPGIDGLETTRRLRAMEQELGVVRSAVLVMSAHALRADVEAALAAGADGHVAKPVSRASLVQAIQSYRRPRSAMEPDNRQSVKRLALPPAILKLVPRFLESVQGMVATMQQALGAGDFTRVSREAHSLKGVGTSYGFPELTELAGLLEQAAKASDRERARDQLEKIGAVVSAHLSTLE